MEGAQIALNEHLDRWRETAVKPRVPEKTYQDYEGMLRRYIRPNVGKATGSLNHALGEARYLAHWGQESANLQS